MCAPYPPSFNIPNNPVVAFHALKNWTKKSLYNKIDLCTQACYSPIVPGLYLANARAASDRSILRHLNITHVLTVEGKRLPKNIFKDTGITTMFIRAEDSPSTNLISYFPMANNFIEDAIENEGIVLVHCRFGVSRSSTIVIAYIMQRYRLTYEQAFDFVQQRRKFINPNPGFVNQLREYQRLNYDVHGRRKLEAYVNVNARKHKYKIVSLVAVFIAVVVPIAILVA